MGIMAIHEYRCLNPECGGYSEDHLSWRVTGPLYCPYCDARLARVVTSGNFIIR